MIEITAERVRLHGVHRCGRASRQVAGFHRRSGGRSGNFVDETHRKTLAAVHDERWGNVLLDATQSVMKAKARTGAYDAHDEFVPAQIVERHLIERNSGW